MKKGFTRIRSSGFTLPEMVMGVAILAIVVGLSTVALVTTLNAWGRGQTRINAEVEASQALRKIRDNLKEAMSVTVDANGQGISFQLPRKDLAGEYVTPPVWDGVSRRIVLESGGRVVLTAGGTSTTILTDVTTTDYRGEGSPVSYRLFTAGSGTVTRSVTVQLVTERMVRSDNDNAYGRVRETILLRNTPSITN